MYTNRRGVKNKVLFDLSATQPNASGKRYGGGRYGEIIFFRIASRDLPLACFYDSRKWLNPDVKKMIDEKGYPLYDIAKSTPEEIAKAVMPKRIYSPLPGPNLYHVDGYEVIGTLHGLRGLETPNDSFFWKYKHTLREKIRFAVAKCLPNWWQNRQWNNYRKMIESDMRIVTVSNHTRASLLSYYQGIKFEPQVFFSPNTSSLIPAKRNQSLDRYFLMVSGNRWEKNNLRAIMAFDRLVSAGKAGGMKAVITGCSPDNFKYKIHNPSSFQFYGYVEEELLEQLYANAYIFVYPSLNEGFGYPPLEAMRYGVPVIASPFSSISEVLEGAALYFNPFSVEEIMSRMLLMMDSARHEEYARLGLEKYKQIKTRQDADLDALIDRLYE